MSESPLRCSCSIKVSMSKSTGGVSGELRGYPASSQREIGQDISPSGVALPSSVKGKDCAI